MMSPSLWTIALFSVDMNTVSKMFEHSVAVRGDEYVIASECIDLGFL